MVWRERKEMQPLCCSALLIDAFALPPRTPRLPTKTIISASPPSYRQQQEQEQEQESEGTHRERQRARGAAAEEEEDQSSKKKELASSGTRTHEPRGLVDPPDSRV